MNPTIKAPITIGLTKDQARFIVKALVYLKSDLIDDLNDRVNFVNNDPENQENRYIAERIQIANDLKNKFIRKIREYEAMQERREYYDE